MLYIAALKNEVKVLSGLVTLHYTWNVIFAIIIMVQAGVIDWLCSR